MLEIQALDRAGHELCRVSLPALSAMASATMTVQDLLPAEVLSALSTVRVVSDGSLVGVQLVDDREQYLLALPGLSASSRIEFSNLEWTQGGNVWSSLPE